MKLFKRKILTPEEKKVRLKERIACIISGLLLGLSFPPFPFPYLMFGALVPFFFLLEKKEGLKEITKTTYITVFVFNLFTLYWVGSWTKEADPFLMISGAVLMFANPMFYLIPSTLFYYARKTLGFRKALMLFPLFWAAFEFLYTVTDLRFPWLTLANGQAKFNLYIQIADVIGAYGITILVLFVNIFIFLAVKEFFNTGRVKNKYTAAVLILVILPVIYGAVRIKTFSPDSGSVKVGLVQPNLNPWEKWNTVKTDEYLNEYLDLSNKAVQQGAKIVLWPESALSIYLLDGTNTQYVQMIREFTNKNNASILTGMPDIHFYFNNSPAPAAAKTIRNSTTRYTSHNSILLFNPNTNEVQRYGKIKLVPFGERPPFLDALPFLGEWIRWNVGISSWNVGEEKTVFKTSDSVKIGGVICIESIYPDFVADFVKKGAQILAVVTNDSWYGYSSGPFQHKEISVLRAVENRRSVVRAANGGISCIINPLGQTLVSSGLFTKEVVTGTAELNSSITFYTKFPFIIPAISCTAAGLITIIFIINKISNRKKRKQHE